MEIVIGVSFSCLIGVLFLISSDIKSEIRKGLHEIKNAIEKQGK